MYIYWTWNGDWKVVDSEHVLYGTAVDQLSDLVKKANVPCVDYLRITCSQDRSRQHLH